MNETLQHPTAAGRFGLSGNMIKYFAAFLMVFDHLHQFFGVNGAPVFFNMLGRPVLPIFVFMCVEGFCHTRSRGRYLVQLLVGFLAMAAGNWVLSTVLPMDNIALEVRPQLMNNVFSTMFMTALYLLFIEIIKSGAREKKGLKIAAGVGLILLPVAYAAALVLMMSNDNLMMVGVMMMNYVPNLLNVEGGFYVVLLGLAFYFLRRWRWAQMLPLIAISVLSFISFQSTGATYNIQWMMVFAAVPLMLYSGRRGAGGAFSKWFFYVFYPAHIYLLYLIAWFLQR